MARPLWIEFAGALYHVTARGNARQDIYVYDADRRQFLAGSGAMTGRLAQHGLQHRPVGDCEWILLSRSVVL